MSHHAHDVAIQRALAAMTGRRLPVRLTVPRRLDAPPPAPERAAPDPPPAPPSAPAAPSR